ncbi:MAG: CPBP family intramembrane metalloprotease, partial [Bacteroidetes bacterium]|nr:CPBP family intramembrane metalloprotease [Bacteroidota bacterium]
MNNHIILAVLFICYCLFFYPGIAMKRNGRITTINFFTERNQINDLNIRHWQGIILFGFPLVIFFNKWANRWKWPEHLSTSQSIVFFVILFVVIGVASKSAYTKQLVSGMDEAKEKTVTWPHIYNYFTLRILFLVVYECFFRGILLVACISCFGVSQAIVINILLYAGIHIINGREQVIASVPFGFALCMLCISWQSVWPATLLHPALSVTHEGYILYLN